MTVQAVLAAVLRRWYVAVAVLVLVGAVGAMFARDDGLYSTRTVVVFEIPEPGVWDTGGSRESGVIALAWAVARQASGTSGAVEYAAVDAPFYGAGIRQGVRVAVPDTGGQWEASYTRAAINIDVVSPDRAWVVEQRREKLAAVQEASVALQASFPSTMRVDMTVDRLSTAIDRVQPSRLSQLFAFTALAAVALLVGGWASVIWDQRAAARRGRGHGRLSRRRTLEGSTP